MLYILLLCCISMFANNDKVVQNNTIVPAYIIYNSGKKVEGKIKLGSLIDNELKIVFKTGKKGGEKTYTSHDLKGFGYEREFIDDMGLKVKQWVHFETLKVEFPPVPFGSTIVFLEREIKGPYSLYCYYFEVTKHNRKFYNYIYYVKNDAGELTEISKDCFQSCAKELFSDYSALAKRVGNNGFSFNELDQLIRDYNYWLVNQHDKNEYKVALKEK